MELNLEKIINILSLKKYRNIVISDDIISSNIGNRHISFKVLYADSNYFYCCTFNGKSIIDTIAEYILVYDSDKLYCMSGENFWNILIENPNEYILKLKEYSRINIEKFKGKASILYE